jgi:hypothetical protein
LRLNGGQSNIHPTHETTSHHHHRLARTPRSLTKRTHITIIFLAGPYNSFRFSNQHNRRLPPLKGVFFPKPTTDFAVVYI